MPKGRGFLGCSQRTRHATPKGERCDRLTRALVAWLSPPLHRRRFPQALRYVDSLAHGEPERPSSPALKGGVFWRRKIREASATRGHTGALWLPSPEGRGAGVGASEGTESVTPQASSACRSGCPLAARAESSRQRPRARLAARRPPHSAARWRPRRRRRCDRSPPHARRATHRSRRPAVGWYARARCTKLARCSGRLVRAPVTPLRETQ